MSTYTEDNYKIFELFKKNWAIVTAGTIDHFNEFTVGWGMFGTLWTRPGTEGQVITVFAHPARYTTEFLKDNEYFTVSFFSKQYKKEMGYIGSHSGRNEDKIEAVGFTPVKMGESVTYKEAELTFLCRKIYQNQMVKEGIAEDIKEYYMANPKVYPLDENGDWNPHWMFIGEIIDVIDQR